MDDTSSASGAGREVGDFRHDPFDEVYTTDYVRRLLAERHYIYARLYNPGGSIILTNSDIVDHDRDVGYSTEIGNSFHLDLIEIEQELSRLPKDLVKSMLSWVDGMTSQQAAVYLNARGETTIRKRRERGYEQLTRKLNGESQPSVEGAGRGSDDAIGSRREGTRDDPVS